MKKFINFLSNISATKYVLIISIISALSASLLVYEAESSYQEIDKITHNLADQGMALDPVEMLLGAQTVDGIVTSSGKIMMIIGIIFVCAIVALSLIVKLTAGKKETELGVVSSCLNGLANNVMMTDENDNIFYINNSSQRNLKSLAGEIRKTFPNFNPDALIGSSIHQFHKDPEDVKRKLAALTEGKQHSAKIHIGELVFTLNVGGIFHKGKRTGTYAEWANVTHQYALERQVQSTAETINSATKDISDGNINLSERTEAQAASIEETTASMQEITERVTSTAQSAQDALTIASDARVAADKGGQVVSNAIEAMAEISNSSKKINEIIGVIDDIAFQTNLLALNAAVEAARAGEQGRGFAVVASEVRSLAGRSAKAAKEIKDLITDSVTKVEVGTGQVNETGECLSAIIESVQKVTDMVNDITSATQEQAAGIDQINKAITQMDSFTQQNAALVEEAASASSALSEQAGQLVEIINKTK